MERMYKLNIGRWRKASALLEQGGALALPHGRIDPDRPKEDIMREQRKHMTHEVTLRGRRHAKAADNSLRFFARIEGEYLGEGKIRGANGVRWRVI